MHCAIFQTVIAAPGNTSILIAYYRLLALLKRIQCRPTYPPPSETKTLAPGYACYILVDMVTGQLLGLQGGSKTKDCNI